MQKALHMLLMLHCTRDVRGSFSGQNAQTDQELSQKGKCSVCALLNGTASLSSSITCILQLLGKINHKQNYLHHSN